MPKVSIIIPCYNCGQYIHETIDSVLAQTYQDFEIIIINDGSTDEETNSMLEACDKPKTKIIQTSNQGPAGARNTGIKQSSGMYILPLDGDDKIDQTYLQKAVQILDANKNMGIVYCEAEFFGEMTGKWELPEYQFPEILLDNVIFCTGFFRRSDWEKTNGYDPNPVLKGWEDYDFWLSLIEMKREVFRIPEVLFFYRRRQGSITSLWTREQSIHAYRQLFKNHPHLYADNINVIFEHILDLRSDLLQSQAAAAQSQAAALQWQARALRIEAELASMQTSPFWKLRQQWLKVKSLVA